MFDPDVFFVLERVLGAHACMHGDFLIPAMGGFTRTQCVRGNIAYEAYSAATAYDHSRFATARSPPAPPPPRSPSAAAASSSVRHQKASESAKA